MLKWKHLQKTKTSNKRYLPVLVFEIELIISQKQERAAKGIERQMETNTKNQNEQQKALLFSLNKEHFSLPFSFICTNSEPMEGG